jgi:hypothetical protein
MTAPEHHVLTSTSVVQVMIVTAKPRALTLLARLSAHATLGFPATVLLNATTSTSALKAFQTAFEVLYAQIRLGPLIVLVRRRFLEMEFSLVSTLTSVAIQF